VSEFTTTTTPVPMPCRMCGKPEHGSLACSSAPGWPTYYVHTVCPDCAEKDKRIADLEQSETELQDACDNQFKATVRQRERAEEAEAELAALKARRCETCRQHMHDDWCAALEFDTDPEFGCVQWEPKS